MSKTSLEKFNKFLEDFFNVKGQEKVLFLKHFFFAPPLKRTLPTKIIGSIDDFKSSQKISIKKIDQKIMEFLFIKINKIKPINYKNFTPEKNLILDFYFDSLDLAEIISIVQQEFSLSKKIKFTEIKTVFDLHQLATQKNEITQKLPPCNFTNHTDLPATKILSPLLQRYKTFLNCQIHNKTNKINNQLISYPTIQQNFLKIFTQKQKEIFCFDEIAGNLSRQQFLLKTIAIAQYLKKNFLEKRIGILLPALSVSTLLIASVQLAGKIPVMFNFTSGKKSFQNCLKISGVKNILTSKKFFNNILEKIPTKTTANFIFLEDAAKKIKLLDKIKAMIKTKFANQFFYYKKFPTTAVILFTSGSENLPKAVPLSQENILENIKACLKVFDFKSKQNFLGFLPPFHSFGFTVNTIMPLISGMRVAYTPDPNDAKTILETIKHTKITAITSTPTFLKMFMNLAS